MQRNGTTYRQSVTVTNTGTNPIPGRISVALDSLTSGVTLINTAGATFYTAPVGSRYVDVSSSDLAPGAATPPFTLTFSNPTNVQINYRPRVLASTAPR